MAAATSVAIPIASADATQNSDLSCAPVLARVTDPDVKTKRAIELKHRKVRSPPKFFKSDKERAAAHVAAEVAALAPLIPKVIATAMIGGELGERQVPDPAARAAQIERTLAARAGSEGAMVGAVRAMLRDVRIYAALTLRLPEEARDEACFPMSSGMAHQLIANANARALAGAAAKPDDPRTGQSVGDRLRLTLIFAAEKLLWPIEVPRVALAAAAPKPKTKPKKAGALPLAAKCQLEAFARGEFLDALTPSAQTACVFYARSFLAAGVDQSVRVAEGIRVELWPDEEEPEHVMRGHAYLAKDKAPLDLYAPAEGLLGPYEWYAEHLAAVTELGQVFPAWVKPRKSKGALSMAGPLRNAVASKADLRKGFVHLLMLPPLAYTAQEIKAMVIAGHTGHATPPEWGRCLGEHPDCVNPARVAAGDEAMAAMAADMEALAGGFSDRDIDALGHWMRDAGAKGEADASAAAAAAPGEQARRAAAVAALPGKAASRGAMRNYYGRAGAGANRFSERFTQLRVRQRLAHTARAAIARWQRVNEGRSWHQMPRGQADLQLLRSA